ERAARSAGTRRAWRNVARRDGRRDARTQGVPIVSVTIGATEDAAGVGSTEPARERSRRRRSGAAGRPARSGGTDHVSPSPPSSRTRGSLEAAKAFATLHL